MPRQQGIFDGDGEEESDNLPATLAEFPVEEAVAVIPEPIHLLPESTIQQAREADVPVANAMLSVIHSMWPSVRTISGALQLVNATMTTLERRRKLLNIPYGTSGQISKNDVVEPPD